MFTLFFDNPDLSLIKSSKEEGKKFLSEKRWAKNPFKKNPISIIQIQKAFFSSSSKVKCYSLFSFFHGSNIDSQFIDIYEG